jgi:hypothetical protein
MALTELYPQGGYDVEEISVEVLPLTWLILRTLNHLARLDLRGVQRMLALDSYFDYVRT